MEELYRIVIDYKHLHPIIFWTGIVFALAIVLMIFWNLSKKRRSSISESTKTRELTPTVNPVNDNNSTKDDTQTIPEKLNEPEERPEKVPTQIQIDEITSQPDAKEEIPQPTPHISHSQEVEAKTTIKVKEKPPPAKPETSKLSDAIVFVNYEHKSNENTDTYPVFRCPKKDTVVRTHRSGNTKRRGYKEEPFQSSIEQIFSDKFIISGNVRLNTGENTRPFEPDIAIIDKANFINLRIDIEIDEPYAGITRQPIHCKGDDVMRDIYFVDRGWIVIRFSEYQVHTKEKECLKFIAEVIKTVDPSFNIPIQLNNCNSVNLENFWDTVQSQKWEKANYRETYLNHRFTVTEEQQETIERNFDEKELKEEKLVNPTSIGIVEAKESIAFNLQNSHPRDKRIKFYPIPHRYTIDDKTPARSATTIISTLFPEFDSYGRANTLSPNNRLFGRPIEAIVEIWKSLGIEAANQGRHLHEQIEKYYLEQVCESTREFHLFKNFVDDHKHLQPYRTEWRIFDEKHLMAGTIDLIAKNGSDFEIYDWKRSTKVVEPFSGDPITLNDWGDHGVGEFSNIHDTRYNRYCLQQSLYCLILEKNYGVTISKMYLIVLHPDYGKYYKVETPYQKEKAEYILRTV